MFIWWQYMLSFSHIYTKYKGNISVRSSKFYTYLHLCTVHMNVNNWGNIISILYFTAFFYLFVAFMSLNIPIRHAKFHEHVYLCTVNVHINIMDNILSILHLVVIFVIFVTIILITPNMFELETPILPLCFTNLICMLQNDIIPHLDISWFNMKITYLAVRELSTWGHSTLNKSYNQPRPWFVCLHLYCLSSFLAVVFLNLNDSHGDKVTRPVNYISK